MRLLIALAAACMATHAIAAEELSAREVLKTQTVGCLNVPPGAPEDFKIEATVTLYEGRPTKVDVLTFSPQTEAGEAVVAAIVRAIDRCEPYGKFSEEVPLALGFEDLVADEPSLEVVMPN